MADNRFPPPHHPSGPPADTATAVLHKSLSTFTSLFSRRDVSGYVAQPNDVFIVTRGKSGTTLMQNLVYQLVLESGGGPEWDPTGTKFKEIGEVVPFLEMAGVTGIYSNQSNPRVFKTGIVPGEIKNESARFIYIMRNGMDVPGSMLDFVVPWFNPGVKLTQADREKIFRMYISMMLGDSSGKDRKPNMPTWFEHVRQWTSLKRDNVIVLNYEAVCRNMGGAVNAVAKFLNLDVSEEGRERVVQSCDRETMAKDPRFRETIMTKAMGWDMSGGVKVRTVGKDGFRGISFTEAEKQAYDKIFKNSFGVGTYEELIENVAVHL